MKTLISTVGLPRSGKTTWSLGYSKKHGIPIVNPDSVRIAIHGQRFILSAEGFVWATVRAMIRALFLAGHDYVILDATNVTRKRRDALIDPEWTTAFMPINTPLEMCKLRAIGDDAILPVIDRMSAELEPLQDDETQFYPLGETGSFPQGSVGDDDEGELQLAIAADKQHGIVRIEFGKLVSWIGLPPEQAKDFAACIVKNADRI